MIVLKLIDSSETELELNYSLNGDGSVYIHINRCGLDFPESIIIEPEGVEQMIDFLKKFKPND